MPARSLDPSVGPPPTSSVVDYALVRRATLADLHAGRVTHADVCDAHPYLLRAARFHGEPTEVRCPVCRHRDPLTHVTYVYGDRLGEASGRPLRQQQIDRVAAAYGPVKVYVVEVCQQCSWNHLVGSHVRGTAQPIEAASARRRTGETPRAPRRVRPG